MKDENLDYCKHIRSELEKYYNGEVYKCPECDELIHIPNTNELKETDEGFVLPCGCTIEDPDDLEQMSLYDYFDEVFDTIYYVGSDKEVRGVRLMVACGLNTQQLIYIVMSVKKLQNSLLRFMCVKSL